MRWKVAKLTTKVLLRGTSAQYVDLIGLAIKIAVDDHLDALLLPKLSLISMPYAGDSSFMFDGLVYLVSGH